MDDKAIKVTATIDQTSFARAKAAAGRLGGREEVKLAADVDTSSFARARAAMSGLSKEAGGAGSVFDQANLSFGQWAVGLGSALPVIIDLTGALGALTASLSAAAAGAGALGIGGAGAGAVGFGGIAAIAAPAITSLKDLTTAQEAADKARVTGAAGAARSQTAAAQQIKAAQEQVATANRGVIASEQQLKVAQASEEMAQKALTQARKDAIRQLQDMKRAALESGTSEKRARLSIQEAEANLRQVRASSTSSILDIRDAELSVTEARQNARDVTIAANRAQQDYNKAQKGGIDQMPGVVSAQQSLTSAVQGVDTAQQGVEQAHRDVAKALSNLAFQQKQANTATVAGGTSIAALRLAQKKAGPEGVRFAKGLEHLSDRWKELTKAGRGDFFTMLTHGLRRLEGFLPTFAKSADTSMRALSNGFDQFLKKATGPEFRGFIDVMTRTFARSMVPIGDAFGNIAKVLERIAVAVAPDVVRVIKQLDDVTKGWVQSTKDASGLRDTIHGLVNQTETWAKLIVQAGKLIVAVLVPGMGQGQKAVKGITATLKEWTDWVNQHPAQMRDFFKQGLETTKELAQVLLGFLPMLLQISQAMRPIARAFLAIAKGLNSLKIGNVSALTVLLGTMVGAKLASGLVGLIKTFNTLKTAALGAAGAAAAATGASEGGMISTAASRSVLGGGEAAAGGLASGLAKALPFAIAAAGIGDIMSSALKGDTRGALFKSGGALAGAVVGGLVGGLPGALIGAGIGDLVGHVLNDVFGSVEAPHVHGLVATFGRAEKAVDGYKRSLKSLREANRHQRDTTKNVREAEKALAQAREQYPKNSRPVLEAETRLRKAKDADRRATDKLKSAERLHGVEKKATKQIIAAAIQTQLKSTSTDRRAVRVAEANLRTALKSHAPIRVLQRDKQALDKATGKLNDSQTKEAKLVRQAAQEISPKFARKVDDATEATKRHNKMLDRMQQSVHGVDGSEDKLTKTTDHMNKQGSKDFQNLKNAAVDGLGKIADAGNKILKSLGVQKAKFMASPVAHPAQGGTRNFRRGGQIPGMGEGDKVPAMLEPGEFVVNKKAARVHHDTLEQMNFKDAPRFAKGGGVYRYPFPKGTQLGRTDMGVDVQGQPGTPVGAMGDAQVISTRNFFAPAYGTAAQGIVYKLLAGAPKGFAPSSPYVYVYEGLNRSVGGGKLKAGQRIGSIASSYPGIETGWGTASGQTLAAASGTVTPGSHMSPQGASFRRFLDALAKGKGIGGAIEKLKRIVLQGPPGALRDMGQGALDKTWKAANAYIAAQQPKGIGGGVSFTGRAAKKGWARVGATYEGLDGAIGGAGVPVGGKAFAELLVAGANQGMYKQDLAATLGLSNKPGLGMPYGTKLWVRMPGANKAIKAVKNDVGSGQAGSAHFKIDIQTGLAKALGWHPNEDVEVKAAQRGGFIAPYVGSFAKGGQVAETGLAHVHKGETVVPGMQRGGIAPTFPRGLIRALRQLVHLTPAHDRQERRAEMHLLQRIARASGPRQLNLISKALDKFGVNFTKAEQKRLQKLARQQRHGGLTHPQHRELHHLRQERRASHEQAHIQRQIEVERELLTEFKQLRSELKEHNRLVKSVRVNEKAALNAVVNLTSSQIGAQGLQKTRNASPGRAARY